MMNEHSPKNRPTTQAAEGVPRLKWTLAEFERLTELGILTEDDRIELIGGELVPMSPKGNRHEIVRGAIHNWLRRNLPDEVDYHTEPGWRVDGNYCEPDFLIGRAGCNPTSISPKDVMLLIEVAHHSLKLDTTIKAGMYAALGVREHWVVNARTLATKVHRDPSGKGYGSIIDVKPNKALVPLLLPALALKLADLPVD
ncbi:MAG: Uma2 family endonuclease [Hyphomicrobiaceae bacterium]|jgi:Uma2 family endonuclease